MAITEIYDVTALFAVFQETNIKISPSQVPYTAGHGLQTKMKDSGI